MRFVLLVLATLFLAVTAAAQAPGPQAPPSCEVQLNGAKFTLGGEMQQHAITVEKLRVAETALADATKKIADLEKQVAAKKPESVKKPEPEKK